MQQESFTNFGKMYLLEKCLPLFQWNDGRPRSDIFESYFDDHKLALCTKTPTAFRDELRQLGEIDDIPGYPHGGWEAHIQPTRDYRLVRFQPINWKLTDDPAGVNHGDIRWLVLVDNGQHVSVYWDMRHAFALNKPAKRIEIGDVDIIFELLPEPA